MVYEVDVDHTITLCDLPVILMLVILMTHFHLMDIAFGYRFRLTSLFSQVSK